MTLGLCAHTVGAYIHKYNEDGLENLVPVPQTGAPRMLTKEQEQLLVEVVTTKTPDEVGFPFRKNWNAIIIKEWVKNNFAVDSHSGMLYVLHRLNLSFARPTYTLAKADPEKQEEFKQKFELSKNLLDGKLDHILFEDESMIRDYQAIEKTWFLRGQQRIIPIYGKHEGVKLMAVLNYETGHVYCVEEKKYDALPFLFPYQKATFS